MISHILSDNTCRYVVVCDKCFSFVCVSYYQYSAPEEHFALCDFCNLKRKNIIDILGEKT